jgi:hypothetical protein
VWVLCRAARRSRPLADCDRRGAWGWSTPFAVLLVSSRWSSSVSCSSSWSASGSGHDCDRGRHRALIGTASRRLGGNPTRSAGAAWPHEALGQRLQSGVSPWRVTITRSGQSALLWATNPTASRWARNPRCRDGASIKRRHPLAVTWNAPPSPSRRATSSQDTATSRGRRHGSSGVQLNPASESFSRPRRRIVRRGNVVPSAASPWIPHCSVRKSSDTSNTVPRSWTGARPPRR